MTCSPSVGNVSRATNYDPARSWSFPCTSGASLELVKPAQLRNTRAVLTQMPQLNDGA